MKVNTRSFGAWKEQSRLSGTSIVHRTGRGSFQWDIVCAVPFEMQTLRTCTGSLVESISDTNFIGSGTIPVVNRSVYGRNNKSSVTPETRRAPTMRMRARAPLRTDNYISDNRA